MLCRAYKNIFKNKEQNPKSDQNKNICPFCGTEITFEKLKPVDHINPHTGENCLAIGFLNDVLSNLKSEGMIDDSD